MHVDQGAIPGGVGVGEGVGGSVGGSRAADHKNNLINFILNPHSNLTFNQPESKLSTENLSIHVHRSQE